MKRISLHYKVYAFLTVFIFCFSLGMEEEERNPSKRYGDSLWHEEKNYIDERTKNRRQALQAFIDSARKILEETNDSLDKKEKDLESPLASLEKLIQSVDDDLLPTIALCFSGGGFRAAFMTLGFLNAIETKNKNQEEDELESYQEKDDPVEENQEAVNLLDCCNHMGCLSGSTWGIAAWIAWATEEKKKTNAFLEALLQQATESEKPWLEKFRNFLKKSHNSNNMQENSEKTEDDQSRFKDKRFLFKSYGKYIIRSFLARGKENRSMQKAHDSFLKGLLDIPMPIYTTISKEDKAWLEVTPYEVGHIERSTYIPLEDAHIYFGDPLYWYHFLAIFGDIAGISYEESLENMPTLRILPGVPKTLMGIATVMTKPVSPWRRGQNPAFFSFDIQDFTQPDNFAHDQQKLLLVDAGFAFNLPIPPLLKKARRPDILIIGDWSAEGTKGKIGEEYEKALASNRGQLPPIFFSAGQSIEDSIRMSDEPSSKQPYVVDISWLDIAKSKKCKEYSTFKGRYKKTEIEKLKQWTHEVASHHRFTNYIIEALRCKIEQKLEKRAIFMVIIHDESPTVTTPVLRKLIREKKIPIKHIKVVLSLLSRDVESSGNFATIESIARFLKNSKHKVGKKTELKIFRLARITERPDTIEESSTNVLTQEIHPYRAQQQLNSDRGMFPSVLLPDIAKYI